MRAVWRNGRARNRQLRPGNGLHYLYTDPAGASGSGLLKDEFHDIVRVLKILVEKGYLSEIATIIRCTNRSSDPVTYMYDSCWLILKCLGFIVQSVVGVG